jgi:hypothetical protein
MIWFAQSSEHLWKYLRKIADTSRSLAVSGSGTLVHFLVSVPMLSPTHSRLLTLSYIVARSIWPSPVGDAVQFADELLEFAFARNDQKGSVQLVSHAHALERGPDPVCTCALLVPFFRRGHTFAESQEHRLGPERSGDHAKHPGIRPVFFRPVIARRVNEATLGLLVLRHTTSSGARVYLQMEQLENIVTIPLEQFLQVDIKGALEMKKRLVKTRDQYEAAQLKYDLVRTSKKKKDQAEKSEKVRHTHNSLEQGPP